MTYVKKLCIKIPKRRDLLENLGID